MDAYLRPRLTGLSDDEYFWEPVADCWSVRPAADGGWVMDGDVDESQGPAVTTIGWRLAHIAVTNLGTGANTFFGDGSVPRTRTCST
jgi:hypothetical protein